MQAQRQCVRSDLGLVCITTTDAVHISNGRTHFNDRAHSDLIHLMPEVFRHAPWIEVEAKHKEIAIAKLQEEWLARN